LFFLLITVQCEVGAKANVVQLCVCL